MQGSKEQGYVGEGFKLGPSFVLLEQYDSKSVLSPYPQVTY